MAEMTLESIFTPENIADPYPMYRGLRESNPALALPDANLLVLSSYELVQATLRHKQLGHGDDPRLTEAELKERLKNPAHASLRRTMLLKNPPDHTRLRGLVVKAFDARRVEAMRSRVIAIANDLVDGFIDDREGDLVRLFTHPLPVIVICDMLGIPQADRQQFITGTRISGRLIDPTPMTPEELQQANDNVTASQSYFDGLCDERRARPTDDLITGLVESENEHGKLTKDELSSNIALLFAAGHETTVNLMGNALLALYRNPDQLALLKGDMSLMAGAVEEFLRYDSSVQLSARSALASTEIGSVQVAEGTQIITLLAAANRDPAVFDEPDTLDITRVGVKPQSFGGGIHYCLGAQLARLEATEALKVLFERLPDLQLQEIDNPDWKQTITLRGIKTMPVTW